MITQHVGQEVKKNNTIYIFRITVKLLMALWVSATTGRLMDYSSAQYIPVAGGDLVIWENFGHIKHVTNLTLYALLRDETANATNYFPQSHMRKLLDADIRQISRLIETINIHHRQARSLNAIGTVLKYIAGTPDHDDFDKLMNTAEQLIDSQDRQFTVNTEVQKEINSLTTTVNKILRVEKQKEIDTGHLYDILLARNRAIITELDNLITSITFAKIGIFNPILLDSNEMNLIIKNEHFTNLSVADVMAVASIKILQYNNIIYFLIRYPIPKIRCKKYIILPVAHSHQILHLQESTLAVCHNQTLALKNCSDTIPTFCQPSSVTSCALQLMTRNTVNCSTTFDNLALIAPISDGLIVINDQLAVVEELNEAPITVNGTYLIIFKESVKINGSIYYNENSTTPLKPENPRIAEINLTQHTEILSARYLHHVNQQNLRHIRHLQHAVDQGRIAGLSTVSIVFVVGLAAYILRRRVIIKRKIHITKTVEDTIKSVATRPADGPHLEGEELS